MDQDHERQIQNAREPLLHGNGGCISTELHVASEQEVVAGAAPLTVTIKAWTMDGLREGFAHVVADAPEQAEVAMTDTPQPSVRIQQLLNDTLCTGTAGALAQALKVMGDSLQADGRAGHAVIARRAEQFVRAMHMHVTRFLLQPDCHLRHPTLDYDLKAAHVDVADVGRVSVHCTDVDGGGWHPFMLEDLNPAGPVDDAVRTMVAEMTRALVQDAIGKRIQEGGLPGFDTFQTALDEASHVVGSVDHYRSDEQADRGEPGTLIVGVDPARPGGDQTAEVVASRDADGTMTVHHLQVHDEYVLGEDGPHAQAVGFDAPHGDEAFGANGS